jgi:hypothetical protein
MHRLRRLAHLARRFFQVMAARPLAPAEQAEAADLLRPEETALFWSMAVADQRHAFDCARWVADRAPGRKDLIRAALLHDVGKRHAPLGLWRRSLVSGLELVGLPVPRRHAAYLAHGPVGARELESAGAEEVVVVFARDHHQPAPPGVDPSDWAVLSEADGE